MWNEISSINVPKKNVSTAQSLSRIPNGGKNGIWYVSIGRARKSPEATRHYLPSRKTPDRKHPVNYPNSISMSCQRGPPVSRARESKWPFSMMVSNGTTRILWPIMTPKRAMISMTMTKIPVHDTILPMRTSEKTQTQRTHQLYLGIPFLDMGRDVQVK